MTRLIITQLRIRILFTENYNSGFITLVELWKFDSDENDVILDLFDMINQMKYLNLKLGIRVLFRLVESSGIRTSN